MVAASDGVCGRPLGKVPNMICDFTSGFRRHFGESIKFVSLTQ